MPILSAIGFGLLLITLKVLAHPIFEQLQATIIAFLHGAEVSASIATQLAASAGAFHLPPH
ncbi:MAG: hypothetical protein WAV21_00380 [Minisyncoccia bacterium]